MNAFDEVVSNCYKVIRPNTPNCASILKYLLALVFLRKTPEFVYITFKSLPIFRHWTKFHVDRWTELGDLKPK